MLDISVKSNIDAISRELTAFAYKQLPFAEARTVTELAKLAAAGEKKAMPEIFDNPTSFTVNSVAVKPGTRNLPIAVVYIRDRAAQYLAPYEYGGVQYLGAKPADLLPVGVAANKYGNLPRNTIRKYMARPDVFMGTVRMGGHDIYGLWQRPARFVELKWGKRAGPKLVDRVANTSSQMKLLVAFHDPVQTKKRLHFGDRAEAIVRANFDRVFGVQLAKAIATAR